MRSLSSRSLSSVTLRHLLFELIVVIVAGAWAARAYTDSNPHLVLEGLEAQWLTSSAYVEALSLQNEGRLTLWQPYIGRGEPAIDNPFSFVLNPLNTVPSLVFGAENGIKFSVVVYAIFAGVGGLVLGYVLRLGSLGRLLLALLCVGRGNMHAIISDGYFQLGVTQAYLPWVTAATLAIIRFRDRRWPIVLLAITLTLLFWAGNIYYTLPALIIVGVLTLIFMLDLRRSDGFFWQRFDQNLLSRVGIALVLAVGLSAVTTLPIFAHQSLIGGHPNENLGTIYEHPLIAALQFFTTDRYYQLGTWNQTYFSFVIPIWFVALMFVVLPPIGRYSLRSPDIYTHRRVLIAALFMIIFFLYWGVGRNPIMRWAYENLPLIGQWRVLSRLLTVSGFWIAVVVAMRVDGLWRVIVLSKRWNRLAERFIHVKWITNQVDMLAGLALIIVSAVAAKQVLDSWQLFGAIQYPDQMTSLCINWLRAQHPDDQFLSVWGNGYSNISIYINNQMRFTHINADFHPMGAPSTLFDGDLSDVQPRYLISFDQPEREYWSERGYRVIDGSPLTAGNLPCLMENPDTLSYAFTVPLNRIKTLGNELPLELTTPLTSVNRDMDRVGLLVNGDPNQDLVVVAQELAWPGWRVTVDGLPARLESVGQLLGVVLPKSTIPHRILFVYDPPLLKVGGVVTLATALLCALYLLNAERFLPWRKTPKPERKSAILSPLNRTDTEATDDRTYEPDSNGHVRDAPRERDFFR